MNPQERKDAARLAFAEGFWGLGWGLVAPLTVLPLLIRFLGGGPVEIGLLYGVATAGYLLTQPIGMLISQHGGAKRRFIVLYHIPIVLPVFAAMGLTVWFLGPRQEAHALARFILITLFSLHILATGVIVPLWSDWVAGLFSTQTRGLAMGLMWCTLSVGMSLTALAAGWIRHHCPFPLDYTLLFAAATVLLGVSIALMFRISAGQAPATGTRPTLRALLGQFALSLRDRNYRRYLLGRVLLTMGSGAVGFMAVHFRSEQGGNLSEATIIGFGAFLTLPQAVGGPWLGVVGDRFGHKVGVLIGAAAQIAALAVALSGMGMLACALCFACLGLAYSAGGISHQNMIFETCPHDNRVAHITLSNLLLGPFVAALPLATGYLIAHTSMVTAFGMCLGPTVLGTLWIIWMVDDPRQIVLGPRTRKLPAWLRKVRNGERRP